jgi:hypothetical protein
MGTWPALEVMDIKTAITPKSGLTVGSAYCQHAPGDTVGLNNNTKKY